MNKSSLCFCFLLLASQVGVVQGADCNNRQKCENPSNNCCGASVFREACEDNFPGSCSNSQQFKDNPVDALLGLEDVNLRYDWLASALRRE